MALDLPESDDSFRGGEILWSDDPVIETDDPEPEVAPVAPVAAAGPIRVRRDRTVMRRDIWGRRQRFEARKVRRLIHHIDPWSVLKASLVFFIAVWVMFMIAAVIVWSIAESSGTVGKIESFVSDLGITGWTLDGEFIVRQYGLIGLILSLAFTVGATIASVMFNLISDIVGGIWITVIEEETARPVSGSPTE